MKISLLFDFFQKSVEIAADGHTVLYISSKPIQKLPEFAHQNVDALKQIIFMYFKNRESLMERLLDLHNWSKTPKLVILDSLQQFFESNSMETSSSMAEVYDFYSIIIATLHDCVRTFSEKLQCTALCVVTLDLDLQKSYNKNLLQTLVDLYYYNDNCVTANSAAIKINEFLS